MLKLSRRNEVDLNKYHERINQQGYIMVDEEKIFLIQKYEEARQETLAQLALRVMKTKSSFAFNELSKEAVIGYLTSFEGCSRDRFRKKGVAGESIDMSNVLEPLYKSGRATEFLEYYMDWSSTKSKVSRGKNIPRYFTETEAKGPKGVKLAKLHYTADQQTNLRFNYHDTDLISIPKEFTPSFTVEEDYVLCWGDFAQSDLRIAYNALLRDEYNGPIMARYEDSYEGISAILDDWENVPHDHEKFVKERDLYKVNVLETLYGNRVGKTPRDKEFIKRFAKYLDTCPRYVEYMTRIEERIDSDLPVPITGPFGNERLIAHPNRSEAINKSLNAPVQMGTSEVVIMTCNAILDMFYAKGYTEEEVNIYMVRHDEPIFKVHKKALKDAWIFNQVSKIIIDDWTPLALDFEFGYYYGEVDEVLQAEVEAIFDQNKDKIVTHQPEPLDEEYWPVPATLSLYVGFQMVADKTIISLYNHKLRKAAYFLIDSIDEDDISNEIMRRVEVPQEKWAEEGYGSVLVYSSFIFTKKYDRCMFYKYTDVSSKGKSIANALATWKASVYAKREGIAFTADMDSVTVNLESLREVGEYSDLQG